MVPRHPYEPLGQYVYDEHGICWQFRKVELDKDFGISDALLAFCSEHGRCGRCDGVLDDWSRHEGCKSLVRPFRNAHPNDLEVALSHASFMASAALRIKESQHRAAFLRKQRMRAAGGSRTRAEVRALLDLQERRCYYCFGSLEGPGGSVNAPDEPTTCHEDHYVSLRWGGGHSISNIVLACVKCNSRKRDMRGDDFARESLERVPKTVRKGLRRIHQARADHPSRLVVVADPTEDEPGTVVSAGETGEP